MAPSNCGCDATNKTTSDNQRVEYCQQLFVIHDRLGLDETSGRYTDIYVVNIIRHERFKFRYDSMDVGVFLTSTNATSNHFLS